MSKYLVQVVLLLITSLTVGCGEKEPPAPPPPSEGELIWTKNCKVCHAQGLNGAPIIGNAAMWSKRVPQGLPTLIEHAINGYGLMPAKGGNADLPDADVAKAVEYMVSKVQ